MMKYFNMITPLVVIAICFLKNYTIYALHLGTVVGLLMQSRFTLFCQIQYKSVWEKTNFQAMKKAMNFIRSHRSFCIL